ncbi:MAG: hypothetical protein ACI81L_000162 [Verrucomicrobiales bacterium]|jgi:hypothetical protein
MADHEVEEWAALSRAVSEADRVRHTPPPAIWGNIAASIGIGNDTNRNADDTDPIVPPEAIIDLNTERNTRAPASRRSHRRSLLLAGAALALLFVVAPSITRGDDTTNDTITFVAEATTFVAEATNVELPEAFDGAATATVSVDDSPTLEIIFDGELPSNEPVELWLIRPDMSGMHSLGVVEPGDTVWDWPAGIDPNLYTLVDLSIEPDDGNPNHSGRSILRGALVEM